MLASAPARARIIPPGLPKGGAHKAAPAGDQLRFLRIGFRVGIKRRVEHPLAAQFKASPRHAIVLPDEETVPLLGSVHVLAQLAVASQRAQRLGSRPGVAVDG